MTIVGRDETDDRDLEAMRARLEAAGVKVTPQRLEVLREVMASVAHPDAETIFDAVRQRLPSVSLDTVYRTLWLFTRVGLLTTLGVPRERYRFDAVLEPHHHFVCSRCGLVADVYSRDLDQLPIPESVADIGKAQRVQVELRGVCLACATTSPALGAGQASEVEHEEEADQ